MQKVNSKQWWNDYFEKKWDEYDGQGQTLFFVSSLLTKLPADIKEKIGQYRTILDWGCAFGQGVDALSKEFPQVKVEGLDFSQVAIKRAKSIFPKYAFSNKSLEQLKKKYDVIFSINCLEHFDNTLQMVNNHLDYCRKMYVLMVPYNEIPLSEYHKVTITDNTFPDTIGQFEMVFSTIIDTRNSSYWPGEQMIVVYSKMEKDLLRRKTEILGKDYFENQPHIATWEKVAETYTNEISNEEREIGIHLLKILDMLRINNSHKIIELGCGSGHLSAILSGQGHDLSLLDFSKKALQKSKEIYEHLSLKGNFLRGDLLQLDQSFGMYDVTWNSGVMEHFDEKTLLRAFKSIHKITKKYFIFLVPNPNSLPYLLFRYKKMREGSWSYGTEYLRVNYEQLLEKAGFSVVKKSFTGWKFSRYFMQYVFGNTESTQLFSEMLLMNLMPDVEGYLQLFIASPETSKKRENHLLNRDVIEKTEYFDRIARLYQKISEKDNENELLKSQIFSQSHPKLWKMYSMLKDKKNKLIKIIKPKED